MLIRHRCNLRQMRDAQKLMIFCDHSHLLGDLLRRTAADSCVDLVKNQRFHRILVCHNCLDRQHDSRQLTAGCHTRKRPERKPRICGNHKADLVSSVFIWLGKLLKCDLKTDIQKIQVYQRRHDLI